MKGPPRKFDHAEAQRLRAEGWTFRRIADRLGVSIYAAHYACSAERRAKNTKESAEKHHLRYGIDDEYTARCRARSRAYYHRKRAEQSA